MDNYLSSSDESTTEMNSSLKSAFSDITDNSCKTSDWVPPAKYGLDNSAIVLQQPYFQKLQRGEKVDYTNILKDDIRNMRPLTNHQIEYIKKLERYDLIEIIIILDTINTTLLTLAGLTD